MDSIVDLFVTAFKFLIDNTLFEVPLFVWLVLPALFAAIIKFIQGQR